VLPLVETATTTGRTWEILAAVEQRYGGVPNGLRVLAGSPVALEAWVAFDRTLARGSLSRALREQLAVLTAELNGCAYCLGVHSAGAVAAGVSGEDVLAARSGAASDPVAAAALQLAADVVRGRGAVADDALGLAREAGLTDAELLEVLAVVALNTFSNYVNRVAGTPDDGST
jgi:uncharacterized peroxidase-related enzyme